MQRDPCAPTFAAAFAASFLAFSAAFAAFFASRSAFFFAATSGSISYNNLNDLDGVKYIASQTNIPAALGPPFRPFLSLEPLPHSLFDSQSQTNNNNVINWR